jgi:glycosyltransferase involved in cell wall biosynthesis
MTLRITTYSRRRRTGYHKRCEISVATRNQPIRRLMKLSVLIPVYNERRTIAQVVATVTRALPGVMKEIVIVDDCSTDGTREFLRSRLGGRIDSYIGVESEGVDKLETILASADEQGLVTFKVFFQKKLGQGRRGKDRHESSDRRCYRDPGCRSRIRPRGLGADVSPHRNSQDRRRGVWFALLRLAPPIPFLSSLLTKQINIIRVQHTLQPDHQRRRSLLQNDDA